MGQLAKLTAYKMKSGLQVTESVIFNCGRISNPTGSTTTTFDYDEGGFIKRWTVNHNVTAVRAIIANYLSGTTINVFCEKKNNTFFQANMTIKTDDIVYASAIGDSGQSIIVINNNEKSRITVNHTLTALQSLSEDVAPGAGTTYILGDYVYFGQVRGVLTTGDTRMRWATNGTTTEVCTNATLGTWLTTEISM